MPTFNNNNSLDLSTTKIDDISTVGGAGQGAGSGNNGNTTGQGQQGAGQQGQQGQQGNGNGNGNPDTDTNIDTDNGNGNTGNQGQQGQGDNQKQTSSMGEVQLSEGDTVNVDGVDYTIDAEGNAIAADGTVFRTATELAELIAQNGSEPSVLNQLQTRFGSDFKDENGNPIVFDDNEEGIAAYVETVVQSRVKEAQAAAINNLFEIYPQVEQVINHLKLNGSLDDFVEIPDRSQITVSKDNEEQQAAFIREEWKLSGKKGDVNKFIDYCKNAGILYDTAVESKEAVDSIYESRLAEQKAQVEAKEAAAAAEEKAYWDNVEKTISKGELLGYSIPEQIQCNKDGKKVMLSRRDFLKYVSTPVDSEGNTAYMLDEAKVDSDARMQDDLLKAFLRFTGGDYASLVGMAVNKQKVLSIRTAAAQTTGKRTVIINSKGNNSKTVDNDQLVLN
ncbi:hypothetical protein KNV28_gp16 [uncultured phage cr107_1]|uniref:Uncharacterized protein n=1 Tax=uncultured phage cr107_1 TaxID=2772061 RepID=A0A7M1RWE4_9CAUD|nr:hypothetical protein KNV28_gp16 [uncultured phage cr107_1]QOR58191.1 hypothetical protein [uncultured phage cr107_1]